ncbi:hypothetical protein QCA50_010506 [Cerrena zonata]|uniref:Zn(2)-C6 fungal-type domain-containing protein n=1 Tax=Cerrena zonata TaxID=2478898 RepID=A0AAW0G441_9APHY
MSTEEADGVEPLPQFVKAWGLSGLSRPSRLPENYDQRIDRSGIFELDSHPDTGHPGPYYVVAKGCTRCVARLRQRCDRGLPACERCTKADMSCNIDSQAWEFLPLEKIARQGYVRVQQVEKPDLQMSHTSTAVVSSNSKPGRPARHAAPKPGTLNIRDLFRMTNPEDESFEVQPLPSSLTTQGFKQETPKSRKLTKTRPAPQTLHSSALRIKIPAFNDKHKHLPKKKHVKQVQDLKNRKLGRPRKAITTTPKQSLKAKFHLAQTKAFSKWKVSRPASNISGESLSSGLLREVVGKPRIWTENKEDLLEIFPTLSNGLACKQFEAPIIFIQGASWPEDSWNDSTIVFSMVRECILPRLDETAQPDTSVIFPPSESVLNLDQTLCYPETPDDTMVELDAPMTLIDKDAAISLGLPATFAPNQYYELFSTYPGRQVILDNSVQLNSTELPDKSYPIFGPGGEFSTNHTLSSSGYSPIYRTDGTFSMPPLSTGFTGMTGAFGPQALNASLSVIRNPSHLCDEMEKEVNSLQHAPWRVPYNSDIYSRQGTPESVAWPSTPPDNVVPSPYEANANSVTDSHNWKRMVPLSSSQSRRTLAKKSWLMHSHTPDSLGTPVTNNTPSLVEEQLVEKLVDIDQSIGSGYHSPLLPDTVTESQNTAIPSNTTILQPEPVLPDPPDDIQALLDARESRFPVSLVVSRDSTLLPFTLPDKHACVFLGFFEIKHIKHIVDASPDGNANTKYTVRWTFTFEWIPGGELDYNLPQPSTPWWMPQPPSEEPIMVQHPFSVLPSVFTFHQSSRSGSDLITISEPIIRKGWHCNDCGKLNVQRYFSFQRCSTCLTPNGMSPVGAMYTRDPHNTAPITLPSDKYPSSVMSTQIKNEENGLRTFVYSVGARAVVKHFFTCNEKHLQQYASELFKEFQISVKLEWQGAKTTLAAGPYFTYLAGSDHEQGHASETWDRIPNCVDSSRKTVENLIQEQLENLTVLAWYVSGNRKSPTPLPAKDRSVTILNLGADVELTLYPVSGFPNNKESSQPLLLSSVPTIEQLVLPEDDHDHMMLDERMRWRLLAYSEIEQAVPMGSLEKEAVLGKGKAKNRVKGEEMFITLVHGDVLQLSGDDFEVRYHLLFEDGANHSTVVHEAHGHVDQ